VLTLSSLRQPGPNHWTKQVQRLGWWAPHRLQESGLHYSSFFLPWVTQHHHWTSRVAEAGGAHPINQETLGPKKLSLTLPGQPPWQTRAGQNSSHYLWAGIIDPLELIFFILKKGWTDLMNWNELGSINLWFFLKNQNRHLKSGEKDVDWFRSSIKRILIFVLRSTRAAAQLAECRNPVCENLRPVLITFGWSTQHVREHECTTPGCFRNYASSRKNFRAHRCGPPRGE